MRKKLTLLFALLCVSVMGFAIDWSGYSYIGCDAGGGFDNQFKIAPAEGQSVGAIQNFQGAGWGIYTSFGSGINSVSGVSSYRVEGAGVCLHCSSFTQEETEVTVVCDLQSYTFTIYNAGAQGSGGGSEDPAPTKESECFGTKGHFGTPSVKNVYYQIDYADSKVILSLNSLTGYDLDFAEVHIMGVGNYPMTPDGNGGYTYTINNPNVNAEWYIRFLYSDTNMPGNEQTAQDLTSTDANIIYYKVGACTFTETENENIALASAGSTVTASAPSNENAALAIDGKEGTRWETPASDPQWICVDFGARKAFNKVQLVHEGAYIKTYDIQVSDDGTNFITIKHVSETLSAPFPQTQSIDLGRKYVARYMRIYGTERGTGYGYSLWELRAMYATDPVLTTYSASLPSRFAAIGTNYQIEVVAKDQLGNDFAVVSTYSIEPATAGSITEEGVYTPAQAGDATITVQGGGKEASILVRNEVSANLAFNQPAIAGYNTNVANMANNSNIEDRWGSNGATHYNGGANPDFQDWWYVDLGAEAIYDIAEIAIKWETARPNDYDIRVSSDALTWTTIKTYNTYPAANNDKSLNYEYYSNFSNPVPCRYVGVWARNGYADMAYGISIYDFQVFGLEHIDAGVNVESITFDKTEATIEMGEPLTLNATVAPVNATDKSITWSSSETSVATVENGVITTVAPGTTTITATANDGSGVYGTCELTVTAIEAKTYWGTYNIGWNPEVPILWSVTRNANKTLTYTVYFGGDAKDKVMQIHYNEWAGNDGWKALTGYTDADRTASYTTSETYNKGDELSAGHFFYFGGPRLDFTYVVGSSNSRPETLVESVVLNHSESSLTLDENLQLSASVVPSYVENKTITWSSDNTAVAEVSATGLVTAKAVGIAHITATSNADGTKTATCTITVSGAIEPATWYGYGMFTPSEGLTGFTYSITRNADRSLTYTIVLDKDPVGFVGEVNIKDDGNYSAMAYTPATRTATYTTAENYEQDGTVLNKSFWWLKYSGGVDRVNFSYTVGLENDALPQAFAMDETRDNSNVITAHDGQTVIGIVGRSFTAGSLYTLVFPFDVDAAMTAEKLPGTLTKLNNTILKENGDLRLNFVDVDAVEAGVPYLYEPSENITNPVFAGVTVSKDLAPVTPADNYAAYHGIYQTMDADGLKAINHGYVLGSDQYLYDVQDLPATQTMKALRGYFVLNFPSAAPGAPRRLAKVVFNSQEEQIATAIEDVQGEVQYVKFIENGQLFIIREGKMYNAQGQLVK